MRRVQECSAHDYRQYYCDTVIFRKEQGTLEPIHIQDVEEHDDFVFHYIGRNKETGTIPCTECFVVLPDVCTGEGGTLIGCTSTRGYKKGLSLPRHMMNDLFRAVNFNRSPKFLIQGTVILYLDNLVGCVHDGVNYIADELLVERFKSETYQEAVWLQ